MACLVSWMLPVAAGPSMESRHRKDQPFKWSALTPRGPPLLQEALQSHLNGWSWVPWCLCWGKEAREPPGRHALAEQSSQACLSRAARESCGTMNPYLPTKDLGFPGHSALVELPGNPRSLWRDVYPCLPTIDLGFPGQIQIQSLVHIPSLHNSAVTCQHFPLYGIESTFHCTVWYWKGNGSAWWRRVK